MSEQRIEANPVAVLLEELSALEPAGKSFSQVIEARANGLPPFRYHLHLMRTLANVVDLAVAHDCYEECEEALSEVWRILTHQSSSWDSSPNRLAASSRNLLTMLRKTVDKGSLLPSRLHPEQVSALCEVLKEMDTALDGDTGLAEDANRYLKHLVAECLRILTSGVVDVYSLVVLTFGMVGSVAGSAPVGEEPPEGRVRFFSGVRRVWSIVFPSVTSGVSDAITSAAIGAITS